MEKKEEATPMVSLIVTMLHVGLIMGGLYLFVKIFGNPYIAEAISKSFA